MSDKNAPPIFEWTPRPWQQTALEAQKRTTVLLCSRRAGKTDLAAYIAGTAFLTARSGLSVCLASFALNNAREVVWSRLIQLLSPLPSYVKHSKAENTLVNEKTGSVIRLFGLSSEHGDKVRGFSFDLAVLDEFPKIPFGIYSEAFGPTLLDRNGWQVLIGTPSGSYDLLHAVHNECLDPANEDTHVFLRFPASTLVGQIPNLTPAFLEAQKKKNPLTYAREYEADLFAAASDTIFDAALLQKATIAGSGPLLPVASTYVAAGLDFAPRRDKSILCVRAPGQIIALKEIEYVGDPEAFCDEVATMVTRYRIRALAVDRGGAGEVISDMLLDRLEGHYPLEDIQAPLAGEVPYHTSNFNLRAELYAMLRDWMTATPGTIHPSLDGFQSLFNQLSATVQKPNDSGKFQLVSKQEIIKKIGHSPDHADAAALSMFFERYTESWKQPISEMTTSEIGALSPDELTDPEDRSRAIKALQADKQGCTRNRFTCNCMNCWKQRNLAPHIRKLQARGNKKPGYDPLAFTGNMLENSNYDPLDFHNSKERSGT